MTTFFLTEKKEKKKLQRTLLNSCSLFSGRIKKNAIVLVTLFTCWGFSLFGQQQSTANSNNNPVKVASVDFDANPSLASQEKKIRMVRDYLPNDLITGPAWKLPGTPSDINPVAFCSGVNPWIQAQFEGCNKTLYAKGEASNGFKVPVQKLENGKYMLKAMVGTFTADKIQFFEDFEVRWFVSPSQTGPWIEAGVSKNPLYVIKSQVNVPVEEERFHSLYYFGCKNGTGATADHDIVDKIFKFTFSKEITNLKFYRRDNPTTPIAYWKPGGNPADNVSCWTVKEMLDYESGRCGNFAALFQQMIQAQGITTGPNGLGIVATYFLEPVVFPDGSSNPLFQLGSQLGQKFIDDIQDYFGDQAFKVVYYNYATMTEGPTYTSLPGDQFVNANFFVKNFDLDASRPFYFWNSEFNNLQTGQNMSTFQLPNGNKITFAPQNGLPAQGNDNPQSTFQDHAFTIFNNGKVYDPSYGTSYNSINEWEDNSIAGYGTAGIGSSMVLKNTSTSMPTYRNLMWKYEINTSVLQGVYQIY